MELRIAVVGCSSVARNHIPHLIKASGVRPTHVLSSANERAALFANQFNKRLVWCNPIE
jgi:predicted dehydrogenase